MAYRRLRIIVIVVSCFLVAAGAIVECMLTLLPLDIEVQDSSPVAAARPIGKEQFNVIPSVAEFGQTLAKRFQVPLEDPPPIELKVSEPKTAVVAPPPLDVILLGTAVESTSSSSKAWMKAAGKPLRLVGVGEKLLDVPGEPELVSIEVGSVVLRVGEREQTITMAKKQELK